MTITSIGPSTQFTQKILPTKNQGNIKPETEKTQEPVELPPSVPQGGVDFLLPENREAYIKLNNELNEKCYFKGATLQDSIDNWELKCELNVFIFSGGKKVLTEDDFKHVEKEAAEFKEYAAQVSNIRNYKPTYRTYGPPILNVQDLSSYYKESSNSSSKIVNSQFSTKVKKITPQKSSIYKNISTQIINSYKKHQSQISSLYKKWTA